MRLDVGSGYLPAFVAGEVLPKLPTRPGAGIHAGLFTLARVLSPWRSEEQVNACLHAYARQCGRHVPESEIASSIRRARAYAWSGRTHNNCDAAVAFVTHPQAPAPEFDLDIFRRFVDGVNINADWLAARSPICPWNRTPASFLHALFQRDEKVIIFDDFQSQGQEVWAHPGLPYDATALKHFAKGKRRGVWFLCNPVDGLYHLNDDGKQSRRSRQSVTAWRYMLLESDRAEITPAQWLAGLALLPLPIASICETGGRLAHALLRVDAASKEGWDRIKDSLVPVLTALGADTDALSAVRLSRLPCCERLGKEDAAGKYRRFPDGPHPQRLLFLNPNPVAVPIRALPQWPTHHHDPGRNQRGDADI